STFQSGLSGGYAANADAYVTAVGLVRAQRLGNHGADVTYGTDAQPGLIAGHLDEVAHHLPHLVTVHRAQAGDGAADPLHFLRPHVPEYRGGIRFAEAAQKDRRLVELAPLLCTLFITHRN